MAVHENDDPNEQMAKTDHLEHIRLEGSALWWWIWIPIIVIVILWIGGWSLGNYGGPWNPQPRGEQPQISHPVVGAIHSGGSGAVV